jgi:glyoxylase-like metal-dependent hydrolase (beta-lactamase superfamily II)
VKRLHREDLWCWSSFVERLNIDFNAFLWTRPGGNVAIDPLPMTPHDRQHLQSLGGLAAIIVTNGDHLRGTQQLALATGAKVYGPRAERGRAGLDCTGWLAEGDSPFPGLALHALEGSKTPGELALVLEDTTILFGDLVRSHRANQWMLLKAEQGLKDRAVALASVRRVVEQHPKLAAALVGDGWCQFAGAAQTLDAWLRSEGA